MADTTSTYSFRTALQGFNRTDVVNFIEATTAAHENALHQLQMEKSRLEQQLSDANLYINQLQQTISSMQMEYNTPPEAMPAVELPPLEEPAPTVAPAMQSDFEELELAAYRRAEQAERNAKERAADLYRQVDALVKQTNKNLAADDNNLTQLAQELSSNIYALQQAMGNIRTTLDNSTRAMQQMDLPLDIEDV